MGIIGWIILGGLAGWIASMIAKTDQSMGVFMNIIVGIIGAGVGGTLWRQATILARASGARTIVLDADIHAVAFYQHMGAVLVDIADIADIPIASTPRMRYALPDA